MGTDSERSRERRAEGARHRLGLPMHNRKSASEPGSDVHPPALSASVRPSHTSTLCIVASIRCSRHMTHRCRTKMHRACSPRSILRGNKRTIACERLRSARDTHNSCRLPSLLKPQRFRGLLCVYEGDLFWQASFSLLRLVTTPYIYPETRQPPASGHSQDCSGTSWFRTNSAVTYCQNPNARKTVHAALA